MTTALLFLTAFIVVPVALAFVLARWDGRTRRPPTSHAVDPDYLPPSQRLSLR